MTLTAAKQWLHIHEAAQFLGVTTTTLRRWEKSGKLIPDSRTLGGWRLYRRETLEELRTLNIYNG